MSVSVCFLYSNEQINQPPAVTFGHAVADKKNVYSLFSGRLSIDHEDAVLPLEKRRVYVILKNLDKLCPKCFLYT